MDKRNFFWSIWQDKNIHLLKIYSKNYQGYIVLCDITKKETMYYILDLEKSMDESERFIVGEKLFSVIVQSKCVEFSSRKCS